VVLRRGGGGGGEEARLNSPRRKSGKGGVLGVSLTVEDFVTAEATGQWRWHARQGHGARMAAWSASGTGGGAVGAARARRGEATSAVRRSFRTRPVERAFKPSRRVRIPPTTAANQGVARGDTATDRWAPLISVFRIKNYPQTKIAQNK
jgi:hypothetical protein